METIVHFQNINNNYIKVTKAANKCIYDSIKIILDRNIHGTVLDVGNGGVFNYDLKRIKKLIVVDPAIKNKSNNLKIKHIQARAEKALKRIPDNSCNNIIIQFLFHHLLNEKDQNVPLKRIGGLIKETRRILRMDGKLIIAETTVNPFIELFQKIFFKMIKRMYKTLNKPPVYFFSLKSMEQILKKNGYENIQVKKIAMGQYSDPLGGWAPGLLKIPSWLNPLKISLFVAQ